VFDCGAATTADDLDAALNPIATMSSKGGWFDGVTCRRFQGG
jgi:hypothetical protein